MREENGGTGVFSRRRKLKLALLKNGLTFDLASAP